MNDELKRKLVNELGECAQEFNKSIVNELQNSIEGIEKYYNLTDEELADLLDVPENYFINMFDAEDADWETRPYAYNIEEREVTADDTIRVRMAPGGGFAVSLISIN